jgi:hypothetical protein
MPPRRPGSTPSSARQPAGGSKPPLRADDVRETPEPRGKDIRAGVGAVPAVWED